MKNDLVRITHDNLERLFKGPIASRITVKSKHFKVREFLAEVIVKTGGRNITHTLFAPIKVKSKKPTRKQYGERYEEVLAKWEGWYEPEDAEAAAYAELQEAVRKAVDKHSHVYLKKE